MARFTTISDFARAFRNEDANGNQTTLSFGQSRIEILSGLTVALALVPEAIAFAFVAGVDPLVGLYAAFIVGLITAMFGGCLLYTSPSPRDS